jgi:hypothetical protein
MDRNRLLCVALALALAPALLATTISPGQGASFNQVGFNYLGVSPEPFSQSGLFVADYATLAGNGFSTGFVNVVSGGNWVIQNLPLDVLSGYPGLGMAFNLGSQWLGDGTATTSITANVDWSATPLTSAPAGAEVGFGVGSVTTNAQGDGSDRTTNPAPPPISPLSFSGLSDLLGYQFGHPASVEQDDNQCGPASFANSLQYLHNRYGLAVPGANISGIAGDPPNSRVGQVDNSMTRAQGEAIDNDQFINGKLNYMNGKGIGGVSVEHQGGDGPIGTGDYTSTSGKTSQFNGKVTAQWILDQLRKGQDVEMNVRWTAGKGHWVTLIGGWDIGGNILVAFNNDYEQGFDVGTGQPANNGGTGLFDGGYGASFLTTDVNGDVFFRNFYDGATARVNFVVAESIPEPGAAVLAIGGLLCLGLYRRRRA